MSSLTKIDGIGEKAIKLFRAVGIKSLEDLAREKTSGLYARLYESNRSRKVYKNLPQIDTVEEWVAAARILRGIKKSSGKAKGPDLEETRPVSPEIPADDPFEWIRLYGEAKEATVLEKAAPRRLVSRFGKAADPKNELVRSPLQSQAGKLAKYGRISYDLGTGPGTGPGEKIKTNSRTPLEKKEAEEGKPDSTGSGHHGPGTSHNADTISLRTRRGLLHPHPVLVYAGALVVILTRLLFVTLVVGTPFALLFFSDYLIYFAVVPALLFLFAILYGYFAAKVRCRVCAAHVFVSQKCLKHENAHRLFGFGYVGSLALHALVFSWFRCLYCGSAIRLRS